MAVFQIDVMTTLDDEWLNFLQCGEMATVTPSSPAKITEKITESQKNSELHISTKTILISLPTTFDLSSIFWHTPVIQYHALQDGIVKKQTKITTNTPEERRNIEAMCQDECERGIYFTQSILEDTPEKCVRKVNIGICKKDVMSFNKKYVPKGAFSNCIVFTVRIHEENYQEVHIKVFQSGKLEIPGMKCPDTVHAAVHLLLRIMQCGNVAVSTQMTPVLINSNFNCGYVVNRDVLYEILQKKYRINAYYDQCSYPGIQCKYYYYEKCRELSTENLMPGQRHPSHPSSKTAVNNANIYEVSFFIFRTGNVLIVGRCNEDVLKTIFDYISSILINERDKCAISGNVVLKEKRQKKVIPITINK